MDEDGRRDARARLPREAARNAEPERRHEADDAEPAWHVVVKESEDQRDEQRRGAAPLQPRDGRASGARESALVEELRGQRRRFLRRAQEGRRVEDQGEERASEEELLRDGRDERAPREREPRRSAGELAPELTGVLLYLREAPVCELGEERRLRDLERRARRHDEDGRHEREHIAEGRGSRRREREDAPWFAEEHEGRGEAERERRHVHERKVGFERQLAREGPRQEVHTEPGEPVKRARPQRDHRDEPSELEAPWTDVRHGGEAGLDLLEGRPERPVSKGPLHLL